MRQCTQFWECYCDLTELIADAAHDGIDTWMPDAFEDARLRFAEVFVTSPFAPSDDFESLFLPTSLSALIMNDRGQLLEQLTRSREALEHWADELSDRLRLAGLLDG
ncbi:MAG: hypothetical protein QM758_28495 [Armatimonas sp.]